MLLVRTRTFYSRVISSQRHLGVEEGAYIAGRNKRNGTKGGTVGNPLGTEIGNDVTMCHALSHSS